MKKVLLNVLILFFICNISYGQDPADKPNAFQNIEKSIVQFTIAVKLDSNKIKNADLFKKLETEFNAPMLDNYYGALKGSGFIISKEGYLVSNHHVSKYESAEESQKRLTLKLFMDMRKKLIPGILSDDEIRTVFKEFQSYIKKASLKNVVRTFDGKQYEIEIIKLNEEDDLSLLKIVGQGKFYPLMLSKDNVVKTGENVFALGYPGVLEIYFDETKTTLTSGVVSAVRDDKWGIQHTASINPGNSGGPLIDKQNKVIGINVGMVEKASGLFFSVPATKLINWLKEAGFERITQQ
jgi:S1-C subfamily serine protease